MKRLVCLVLVLLLVGIVSCRPSITVQEKEGELGFLFGETYYKVIPWGNDGIRVQISPNLPLTNLNVQALLPSAPRTTEVVTSGLTLDNGNIRAEVDERTGAIEFSRISDKEVLLTTESITFNKTANNRLLYEAGITFTPSPKETGIYGLGQHTTGTVQNKPIYLLFQNAQIYSLSSGREINIPHYVSYPLYYNFVWNLPSFGYLNLSESSTTWFSNSTYQIDFWISTLSNKPNNTNPFTALMNNYVNVAGHPPMLPYYASGFWQSKNRYINQTEFLDIANGYYSRSIPLSVLVVDYMHWVNFGDWSFNPQCWHDPTAMVKRLKEAGTEVMISLWPLVSPQSVNVAAMIKGGFLINDKQGKPVEWNFGSYIYDAFNPGARAFLWQALKSGYYRHGIKTFWLDADEPQRFTPDQSGQYWYYEGQDSEVGMAYPRYHQQAVYDGLRSENETEFVTLSRSAWAGSQRFYGAVWSGDTDSSYEELYIQIRLAQNMAMSGIYWWTTDIGGYEGADITDGVWQELIVRWFQFGAFCPLFRIHGYRYPLPPNNPICGSSGGRNEVWEFGQKAEVAITEIINLRQQLRGYIMNMMKLANQTGEPVIKPMIYYYSDDPVVRAGGNTIEGQYLFGHDWLVSPVTSFAVRQWRVYLPDLRNEPGRVWMDWYGKTTYNGGTWVTYQLDTSLRNFPLFLKSYSDE